MTRLPLARITWESGSIGRRADERPPWHCLPSDRLQRLEKKADVENDPVSNAPLVAQNIAVFVKSLREKLHSAALTHEFSRLREAAHQEAFATVHRVIEYTQEICGCPIQVKESHDPEYPLEKKIVLTAEIAADNAVILDLERKWIRFVSRQIPQWGHVRLVLKRKK